MTDDTEELSIEDFVYLNFGYDFGTCDECNEAATSYDKEGRLLCEACIKGHHLSGDYNIDPEVEEFDLEN